MYLASVNFLLFVVFEFHPNFDMRLIYLEHDGFLHFLSCYSLIILPF